MKQVEASAKTREEAIKNALEDLGVEMYEVDKIEVLDEGSKGLFGFGARPVKVRLLVENIPDEPQRPDKSDERPQRNNRGRGNRNQDRESRSERPERSENREGRGRGRGGRNTEDKPKEAATNDAPSESNEEGKGRRNGRGESRPQRERCEADSNRTEQDGTKRRGQGRIQRNRVRPDQVREEKDETSSSDEVQRSRGDRGRNRGDRKRTRPPESDTQNDVVESAAPVEPQPDGIAADAIEPISDTQGNEAAALMEEIISHMGIEAKAAFARSEDGSARLNVSSEDSAILIGRKGRNLSAMQYLINRMISRGDTNESSERLVVDVEGYVDRRRESLQDMARSMAERAKESQRNMRLKPLSPQERRIIHLTLQEDEDIRTFSLGESLYRSVVISPKGAAQPERGRSSRGGRGGRRRGGRGRSSQERQGQNQGNSDGNSGNGNGNDQDVDVGAFGD